MSWIVVANYSDECRVLDVYQRGYWTTVRLENLSKTENFAFVASRPDEPWNVWKSDGKAAQ